MQGLGRFAPRGRERVFGVVIRRHCERLSKRRLTELAV
jgi:hypothetical protein